MKYLFPDISSQLSNALGSIPFFMPEIYITVLFVLVIVTDLLFGKTSARLCRTIACAGMVVVIFKDLQQFEQILSGGHFLFGSMLLLHRTAIVFKLIIDLLSLSYCFTLPGITV
jgi:NADH-quinone oxidoreductase subunit N